MRRGSGLGAGVAVAAVLVTLVVPVGAADSDKDGLRDAFESRWGVTDPLVRDTDHDGVIDAAEDDDGDGVGNHGEQRYGTDPGRRDSDRDGIPDGREDRDRDGRTDAREQDQRPVPANLKPSLGAGRHSFPPIRFRCQTAQGRSIPVACSFGPRDADTRVVLVGDSHAMMWSSPVRRVAVAKGWRLTTMTKTACSPLLGIHPSGQLDIDGGVSCRAWQHHVIERLRRHPPDLVVVTQSDRYPLVSRSGSPLAKSTWPATWEAALKRTLDAWPKRSAVLVLGDVPHSFGNPRKCLVRHRGDMSACVTPKPPATARRVERALHRAAKARGATFRTLFGKICSYDPCPVVQGHILMWRDKGHVTNTYALQLQPSMRAALEAALR